MEQNSFFWPLINDNITEQDKVVMSDFILNSNRFTNGPKVKEFEKAWSRWLGVEYSVFVNSGASANYIMMSIVKQMTDKREVIVPPIGWVSDIAPVVNLGMVPVFVDVDISNMAITAKNIREAITENTAAITLVHALGFNAINEEIVAIAKENNILLIEDCCESHGATFGGQKIGNFGDMSNFSFYFGHHITTIEGGMVCTNSEKIYDLAKLFRSHGMVREASNELQERYKRGYPDLNPLFTFAVPGYNMRNSEINAVLGLNQLDRLDHNIARRRENLEIWLAALNKDTFFVEFDTEGNSSFSLPLILRDKDKKLFDKICDLLTSERVEFRVGTAGGGNQARQPYLETYKIVGSLENSDHIHDYGLYIGNHTDLTRDKIEYICNKINEVK